MTPLPSATPPLRILYAEEFGELRNFTRTLLARDGHLVETVSDGAAALAWLERADAAVDLLITGHHLPGLDGLELVRRVRQSSFAGKLIVLSAELNPAVHGEYHDLGVDLILPQPIFPVTLRRLLDALFAPAAPAPVARTPEGDLVLA